MASIIKVNDIKDAGGNTIISSNGSGTFTPSSSLATGNLANTPAFFINKSSRQDLSNNTFVKITFDSVIFDTDSAYASDKFTVPTGKGGKYVIGTSLLTDANAVSNYQYANIKFYLNGAEKTHHIHDIRNNAGFKISLLHEAVLDLSAGDYIEVYCRISDLSSTPDVVGNPVYQTYFYGYKLIGA